MATIQVTTAQNVDIDYAVAPLGERVLAYIIDYLIRIAYVIVLVIVFSLLAPSVVSGSGVSVEAGLIVLGVLLGLPFIFYHLLFEVFNNGQTPGKKVFDLRVASMRGHEVTIGQYILRWLFRLVDINLMSGIVALIAVAASDKGQRIGDMVAGTTLIKEERAIRIGQLAFRKTRPEYTVQYPQVRLLKSEHIELIKETLDSLEVDGIAQHVELLAVKMSQLMQVEFEGHPRKFLRTITNDYSHLMSTPLIRHTL